MSSSPGGPWTRVVAIEAWKLGHDGQYPETLAALVPGLLASLPIDPYSGKPFGYVRSEGQSVIPPIYHDFEPSEHQRPTRPGQPLIYSIGVDRTNNGGVGFHSSGQARVSDYVYAIP